ncbi:MAG TPA: Gfo/Idh/MocA family oxidoreductase [Opitutus sp.]|nr:Gfo/Idh/MocA family oxidoreductase [Opitutus sp.]
MIRAAIAGLGWWGKHMVRRMKDSDALRIVTAVEANPAHESFATEHGLTFTTDFAAVLKDPEIDAVILCTPHSMHTEQVLAVAAAKKHVFCEKPLALTRTDAERSVQACREAGVMLGIGHERRYELAIEEVRRLVNEGPLGTIMHVEAHFNHDKLANVPEGDWRASPKDAPAAGMTAMGIHLTDLFAYLFGPISEVFAATTSRVAYKQTGDVISAHVRFASGATGYFNAILVTALYIKFTVFGSDAWVEVRNLSHPDTPGPTTLTFQHRDGRLESRDYEWADTVKANLEAFARAAQGKGSYIFTDEQKIGNVAVLEAVYRSAASNAPVAVSPVV